MRQALIGALLATLLGFSASQEVLAKRSKQPPISVASNQPFTAAGKRQATAPAAITDKWALVIGISNFKDPSIKLRYAAKDARDFYDFLVNQAHFAKDHVRLLVDEDATRENILDHLGDNWLPRVTTPNDLVVIYISSHGSASSADVGCLNYLVAYNTDKENLFVSGISLQDLTRLIKYRVHSDRVVVLLDACQSGAARMDNKGIFRQGNFDANEFAKSSGQLVICSSEPKQSSWESKQYPNGVFTHQLIKALKEKNALAPLGEVFSSTRERVAQEVLRDRGELQRPILKSAWDGSTLALGVVPSNPRPGIKELPLMLTNEEEKAAAEKAAAEKAYQQLKTCARNGTAQEHAPETSPAEVK